jgi:hypothetical protein
MKNQGIFQKEADLSFSKAVYRLSNPLLLKRYQVRSTGIEAVFNSVKDSEGVEASISQKIIVRLFHYLATSADALNLHHIFRITQPRRIKKSNPSHP